MPSPFLCIALAHQPKVLAELSGQNDLLYLALVAGMNGQSNIQSTTSPGTTRWCQAITALLTLDSGEPRVIDEAVMGLIIAARDAIGTTQAAWVCLKDQPHLLVSAGQSPDAQPPMHPDEMARLVRRISEPVCCSPAEHATQTQSAEGDGSGAQATACSVVVVPVSESAAASQTSEPDAPPQPICTEALCFWTPGQSQPFWHPSYGQLLRATAAALAQSGFTDASSSGRRSEAAEGVRHLRLTDELTGLRSRMALESAVADALERRDAELGHHFALFLLDFDGFQTVNLGMGVRAGDELLRQIGNRLSQVVDGLVCGQEAHGACRQRTVARVGSDEFAVLIDPIYHLDNADTVAKCLHEAFDEPFDVAGQRIGVTMCQGVVTGLDGHEQAADVVRDAEMAMRHAKQQGRSRTARFDPAMQQDAVQRLVMERDMRGGLDRREFFLEYQPIVSLETAELEGFEALVRWQHPELGRVRPDLFIGVAEETGLIVELGAWVLDEATRQIAEWNAVWEPRHDGHPLTMNINLSKRQLADADIAATVARTLRRHNVDPAVIKLEVTESVIMGYRNDLPVLQQIKDLGVQLAMDDFGTGHSSLACLHQFPIDVLKIDRAFVMNLDNRAEYAAVIQAIVVLAKNLGMSVVAEGIETREQLVQLQTLECNQGQGYLFAKPLNPAGVTAFFDQPQLLATG